MRPAADAPGERREWALSLHDVAPATWEDCERLLELVAPYGVPVTLLVTPWLHGGTRVDADPRFVAALRAALGRGHEAVLHGWRHRDEAPPPRTPGAWLRRRVLTAAEGEFAALAAPGAARRIAAGLEMLRGIDVAVAGFVPPAWLASPGTWRALRASGLRYASTRDHLHPLPEGAAVEAPSLVYSTRRRWRRAVSRAWNDARLARLASAPRVRVALHPPEARLPAVRDHWRRLCDALAAERVGRPESAWLPPAGDVLTSSSASCSAPPGAPARDPRPAAG